MIDPDQLKSKLSVRLVVAVMLIVASVGILSLVEHFGQTREQKAAPSKTQSLPASRPASMPEAAASSPKPAETPPPPVETPPLPSVSNVAPYVKASPGKARAKPVARRFHERPKSEYTLQFGVFSSESNGDRMVSMLKKKGVRPKIDILVLTGPYPDREAAGNAGKKLGKGAVPVPLPGKGYALQVGAFDSAARARKLAGALGRKGVESFLETRVRAGAYGSRKAALDSEKKLGIPAIVVRR